MRSLLLSLTFLLSAFAPLPAQVEGNWYAILNAMGTELPIGLEITKTGDAYAAVMTSPSQTKTKIPAELSFDGKKVVLKVPALGAGFSGVLDGKELKGVFSQAKQDFPMTFYRYRPDGFPIQEGPITITARSQEPRDFPYERAAVTFPGGADGVTLAGELTTPGKTKPKALIVLVSGSGPQDRNAYLGSQINHSPFLVLSDYLTRQGYGVLRYDDRGVGESTGDFAASTSDDFAKDAGAAVGFLKSKAEYAGIPIGVAGHSEGGMIAPVVATNDEAVKFLILLAAPAVSIDSLMLEQRRQVFRAMGQPEVLISRDEPALRAAYAWIKDNPGLDREAYVEGLYGVFEGQMKFLPPALQKSIVEPKKFYSQYVRPLSGPWMRRFIAFEPEDFLRNIQIPVLALNGLKDTQVDGLTNLNALARIFATNGNKEATIVPFPELNHLFQPADTGAPSEYGTIETTFDPAALETIGSWLKERY